MAYLIFFLLYVGVTTAGVFGLAMLKGRRWLRALGAGLLVLTIPMLIIVTGFMDTKGHVGVIAAMFAVGLLFVHTGLAAGAIHVARAIKVRRR